MVEPVLTSMVVTAGIHILIEVLVHEARSIDDHIANWHGKPINHDLEKALKRSFHSAQQAIAFDCQQKEQKGSLFRIRLSQKYRELMDTLKRLSPKERSPSGNSREQLFDSLEHLQSFLVPDPQLAKELNQDDVKAQLIELALAEDPEASECYKTQIKERLFEEVRNYFIREIKTDERVRSILMAGSQAEMTAKIKQLERGQTEMMKLLTELRDFQAATSWQAKMKLGIDLTSDLSDDQILAVIKNLKQQGFKTLRVEAGCVVVVVEGSEIAIKQLENLTEIAGCRVEKLTIIPGYPSTSLLKWLQKQFEESVTAGWRTLEEVLGPAELAFMFRADKIQRAKELDLGNGVIFVLMMQVEENGDDIQVTLKVRAKDKGILPTGLTLSVSQDTGESQKTQASKSNDYLEQKWAFSRKETFTVKLSLDDMRVTEMFSI